MGNSSDFPSSSDEHYSSPETDTSNARYLSREPQPPNATKEFSDSHTAENLAEILQRIYST